MSGARKNNSVKIPRWKIIIYFIFHITFIASLGTGLIFAHDMATQFRSFSAKNIIIKGNKKLTKKEILKVIDINQDKSLLSLNIKVLRAKLINHPWIKRADIIRTLPDTLRINIEEELPVARVKLSNSYLLNQDGKIFKKIEKSDLNKNYPIVLGLSIFDIEENNFVFQSVLEILHMENNPKKLLYPGNFSKIAVDRDTGICIYNTNICRKLIMGFNAFEDKYHNLQLLKFFIEKNFPGQKLDKIDLSKKNRVVIKPFPAMG